MFSKILSATLLIAGTTIGAGMLGIPLLTAKAGFWPAAAITVCVWLFMLATGLLFLEATLWMGEGANLLSIAKRFLGQKGKFFSGACFLFLYYCLMVAYFAAGAPLFLAFLPKLLPSPWDYLFYGLVFGALVAFGIKWIDRINYLLMAALFLSYFLLLGAGAGKISWDSFAYADWKKMAFAAPILFSSFGFHNIIPSLVTYFQRDVKVLRWACFWGTAIPCIIYLLWQALILGALPLGAIEQALAKGKPATAALQVLTQEKWIVGVGQFFAFFAIVTSMIGVAFSMVDFLGDGLKLRRTGISRIFLTALVFFPPFFLTSLNPSVFVLAISFAGGFGEAILNGILPVLFVWKGRYIEKLKEHPMLFGKKGMLVLLLSLALLVMVFEALFILHT